MLFDLSTEPRLKVEGFSLHAERDKEENISQDPSPSCVLVSNKIFEFVFFIIIEPGATDWNLDSGPDV